MCDTLAASSTSDNIYFSQLIRPNTMRSTYWKYFGFPADDQGRILTRKKIICACCNAAIAYNKNTTNLKAHLQAKHPEMILNIKPPAPANFIFSPNVCDSSERQLSIIDEPSSLKKIKLIKDEPIISTKADSSGNDNSVLYTSDSEFLVMDTIQYTQDDNLNDEKEAEENNDYLVEYVTPSGETIGDIVVLDSSHSDESEFRGARNTIGIKGQQLFGNMRVSQRKCGNTDDANNKLIEMIIENFLPTSIVAESTFKSFCKSLNETFQLPSATKVSSSMSR